MKLVNLTPHTIHIYENNAARAIASAAAVVKGQEGPDALWADVMAVYPAVMSIPSSGNARAEQVRTVVGSIEVDGLVISIGESRFGAPVGLPEPEEGVLYIVSALTLAAAPARNDLLVPAEPVRDWQGRVIGCASFDRAPRAGGAL